MDERTFCCPRCRLLQSPGTECVECGEPIGEIEASIALLHYRASSDVTERRTNIGAAAAGVGVAAATTIGSAMLFGPMVWAGLPIIAYLSFAGTGAFASMRARKYGKIVAIDIADPELGAGVITRTGIARPLTGPVLSKLDGGPILAEQVVIRDGSAILLRRIYTTPFVISNDENPDELVVLGALRLATPVVTKELRTTNPLFAQIGIPAGYLAKNVTVDIRTVRPGTIVAVRGAVEDATLQELASLRGGGQALAMHGRRGSLVVVGVP